jgi:hypothetical protein
MKPVIDTITVTFHIQDKEKFKEFHKKILAFKPEEINEIVSEIGANAIISSWSNPFDENDKLEKALDYALDNLMFDERDICEIIAEKGCSVEEAEKELDLD